MLLKPGYIEVLGVDVAIVKRRPQPPYLWQSGKDKLASITVYSCTNPLFKKNKLL